MEKQLYFYKTFNLKNSFLSPLHKSAEKSSLDVLAFFHLSVDEKNLAPLGP